MDDNKFESFYNAVISNATKYENEIKYSGIGKIDIPAIGLSDKKIVWELGINLADYQSKRNIFDLNVFLALEPEEIVNMNFNGISDLPLDGYILKDLKDDNNKECIIENMALASSCDSFDAVSNLILKLNFNLQRFRIEHKRDCIARVAYYLPNLLIGYDKFLLKGDQIISTFTPVNIDESLGIELYEIPANANIKETEARAKLTSVISYNTAGISDNANLISRLLRLLSLAYGAYRNYFLSIGTNADFEIIYEEFKNPYSNNYSNFRLELIDTQSPHELSFFIKNTLQGYCNQKEEIIKAVERFVDGVQVGCSYNILPIPINILGSVIEDFISRMDELKQIKQYFIPKEKIDRLCPDFINRINQNIEIDDIDKSEFIKNSNLQQKFYALFERKSEKHFRFKKETKEKIFTEFKTLLEEKISKEDIEDNDKIEFESSLKDKFTQLMQKNLKGRIYALLNYCNIEYDNETVEDFVELRNNVTHSSYDYMPGDILKVYGIVSLLHMICLSMIGYNGNYIDWSVSPPDKKVFKSGF